MPFADQDAVMSSLARSSLEGVSGRESRVLPLAADIPPAPAPPPPSWRVWAISGHGLLSQSNGWGREMQNWLVPVILSTHTQGLQLGEGGFNMDKWHIKAAGPAAVTAWGLVRMGQPCLSVVFCSPLPAAALVFLHRCLTNIVLCLLVPHCLLGPSPVAPTAPQPPH